MPWANAVRVGDNERRAVECFGLQESLDALGRIGEGDVGHIDRTVRHPHHPEILFRDRLAAGSELGDSAHRGGLGGLSAGIGVYLGIENQQV